MPVVPRQGRKGGKISASPAIGPADGSASAVSPGSLPPSDGAPDLEFKIEALMDSRRSKAKANREASVKASEDSTATTNTANASTSTMAAVAESGATATTPATETSATAATASFTDANVFKFDLDAIDQIGQGVVIGGSKNIRTDVRKPQASTADVNRKLSQVFAGQKTLAERAEKSTDAAAVQVALRLPVVLVQRQHDAAALAAAISRASPASPASPAAKVLVVVPRYFEVALAAKGLRGSAGEETVVGELCGQSFVGPESCRLWVACAETAFTYLRAQKSLAPFTHVVVPNFSRMTPLLAYFLWGLRERVFRQSANLDPTAPPLHLVLCANRGSEERVKAFFAEQEPVVLPAAAEPQVTEFTYDEANAMAGMNVLDVDVDTTGKFPGPHRKLVEHTVKLAAKVVGSIVGTAPSPQCVFVMTADVRDTVEALQAASLPNTQVFSGRNSVAEGSAVAVDANKSRVHVLSSVRHFAEFEDDVVNFVVDLGTVRRLSQHTKSESFMTGSSSEWASACEIDEHMALLTPRCTTGYFGLYPPAAADVFLTNNRASSVNQAPIFETEDALLQCCRAKVPVGFCHDVLVPTDAETLEQVAFNLSEKCLLASPQDLSITFLGEVAARLPLEIDLAHLVINGCTMGLGEAAVVIASVCALPFRTPVGNSASELEAWKATVLASRRKYAGPIASQSDILADALVYLEWCKRKASGESTAELVAELHAFEQRLEQIDVLMRHLRLQLSDYVFIDNLGDANTLREVSQSIMQHATIFTFLEAVSLARRTAFVRDAGTLNPRDRAAALTFVRSSKKVMPLVTWPSCVPWEVGAALVAVDLRNSNYQISCGHVSVVSTAYLFASLLLLHPQIEYSEPAEVAGKGRVVFIGVTCNRQMKRFRLSIEEAAAVLDFREKWNAALGFLQVLRTRRRPISRRRFELELKEQDRAFDLTKFYARLQREFVNLVTELEVSEHQGSFTTFAVHCFCPATKIEAVEGCEASDVIVTTQFHDGDLWRVAAHAPSPGHAETPVTLDGVNGGAALAAMTFPTQQPGVFDDDDDEIEFIAESYFMKHGPIIDEDDE